MEEILKPIENFDGYFISNKGNVYSKKSGVLKKKSPSFDGKKNYLVIGLNTDGKPKHFLVHRLVAKAFIPNPENLPEVNHKDKNKKNNCVENLEWCTRRQNLEDSYSTMSPNRNFQKCKLFIDDECVGEFDGVIRAARFASEQYGASESSLEKYLKWLNIRIAFDGDEYRKVYEGHSCTKTQNRKIIYLYKDEELIGEFKTYVDVQNYFKDIGIIVSDACVRKHRNNGKELHGFKIIR